METVRQLQRSVTGKLQQWQNSLDAKNYGSLCTGAAGALMCIVFCPMSIVAIATPYWTYSEEAQGKEVSSKASLWKVFVSVELQGMSSESEISMCSDEMSSFDDCGKIDAIRFFLISALLLSMASAILLILSFSPVLSTESLRRKMSLGGVSLAAVVLLWAFLAVCIAGSVDMPDNYNLNGVGFIFLVLELFFVVAALALGGHALRVSSSSTTVVQIGVADARKPPESSPPTLMGQQSQGGQETKAHSEDQKGSKPSPDNPVV